MLIFPNLADERGDRVTAIVRSGWGHATGCMVSQSVQIWRTRTPGKIREFCPSYKDNYEKIIVSSPHSPALHFGSLR